jgi:hypothetical protein
LPLVNIRKVINKAVRHQSDGVNAAGDVNAVVAANVGEKGSETAVSSRQSTRIVQRSGRTEISESTTDRKEGGSQ